MLKLFVKLAAVLGLVIIVTSCASTMSVSSHVQRGLALAQYRTYAWGVADALPTSDPRLDKNPFFQDYFQGAIEKQLAAKGLLMSASGTPDLLIHYHANIAKRIHVDRADHSYGSCYGERCQTVTEYEAGTLVLDIVDAHTSKLIWRGWAQDNVEDMLENRDNMASKITEAVTRMLERFPGRT